MKTILSIIVFLLVFVIALVAGRILLNLLYEWRGDDPFWSYVGEKIFAPLIGTGFALMAIERWEDQYNGRILFWVITIVMLAACALVMSIEYERGKLFASGFMDAFKYIQPFIVIIHLRVKLRKL